MKPRKTLMDMAKSDMPTPQPVIAGKPASICPYCGAGMFIDGVNRTDRDIVRYVECRNPKCRRRFVTHQQPAKIVRELTNSDDDSAGGIDSLLLSLRYA